jgi:hypothetical protein
LDNGDRREEQQLVMPLLDDDSDDRFLALSAKDKGMVLELIKITTVLRTSVKHLEHELLGNGQPGRISRLEASVSRLSERIADVERMWRPALLDDMKNDLDGIRKDMQVRKEWEARSLGIVMGFVFCFEVARWAIQTFFHVAPSVPGVGK